jgi:hypothetical protein
MVLANLPLAFNINSSDSNKENVVTSEEKNKRKHNNELLIEAIKESNNNKVYDESATKKMLYMEQQTERNNLELKLKERAFYLKEWDHLRTLIENLVFELNLANIGDVTVNKENFKINDFKTILKVY